MHLKQVVLYIYILAFFWPTFLWADSTKGQQVTKPSIANQTPIIIDRQARFHPVTSTKGMVVSQEAIASHVGANILPRVVMPSMLL